MSTKTVTLTPSLWKSTLALTLMCAGLCVLSGCQHGVSAKSGPPTLQQAVNNNTERTTALTKQYREGQQELTEALITVCDELRALKTTVNNNETKLLKALAELQSQQKTQQAMANDVSTHVTKAAQQMQSLSQNVSRLSTQFDTKQKQTESQVNSLVEAKNTIQTTTHKLQGTHDQLLQKVAALQASLTKSEEQLTSLRQDVDTLKKSRPKNIKNNNQDQGQGSDQSG